MANMKIFITGVSCVGKTAIGRKLADLMGIAFFDFDEELEAYFGKSIEHLQNEFLTMYSYRKKASEALVHLLDRESKADAVVALPPSGLMDAYLKVVRRAGGTTVVLEDTPSNILARIRFYDVDSRPISKVLTEEEKRYYLKDIKADASYFRRTYKRADVTVDLAGLGIDDSAAKVMEAISPLLSGRPQ